jgi:CelD/BcsL family acetyltransferase involved in cellulose biosynthesis
LTGVGRLQHTSLVTELSDLEEIESEWRELAELRGNAFITPEWFYAWYRHYGEGYQPFVAVLRSGGGEIEGVLPLVAPTSGRFRSLRFAGENLGDYFHPAARPGNDELVTDAIARELATHHREWGFVVLSNVDTEATWPRSLESSKPSALSTVRSGAQSPLPYIQLRGLSWDEYLASRSTNFRRQLRRELKGLQRDHTVRYRRTLVPAEVERDIGLFFELHDRRWASRGGSSSASERAHAFHEDFAARALERGWLRLWFLEADGVPIAAWYGWRLGPRYSAYLGGFDPEWSRYSVGKLLLTHTIREATEERVDEYDLLLGEEAYKLRFATARRAVQTMVVVPSAHPMRLLIAADLRLRKAARSLPEGTRRRLRSAASGLLKRLPTSRAR